MREAAGAGGAVPLITWREVMGRGGWHGSMEEDHHHNQETNPLKLS